jgi:hypothetical protein
VGGLEHLLEEPADRSSSATPPSRINDPLSGSLPSESGPKPLRYNALVSADIMPDLASAYTALVRH